MAETLPGTIPPARMPVVVTSDWVQNSNDSFWLSNPRIAAPAGNPPSGNRFAIGARVVREPNQAGCRVDIANHFYCYSFEPSDHWTEFFAQQPENLFPQVLGREKALVAIG